MAVEEGSQSEVSEWIKVQADRFRWVRNAKKSIEPLDPGIRSYAIGVFIFNRDSLRKGMDICYRACEMDLVTAVTADGADMIYAVQIDAETGEMRRSIDPVGKRLALKIASSNDSNVF